MFAYMHAYMCTYLCVYVCICVYGYMDICIYVCILPYVDDNKDSTFQEFVARLKSIDAELIKFKCKNHVEYGIGKHEVYTPK